MLRDRAQNQPVDCFRYGVAQRAGQRANCVISNRLPRFRIEACSALVLFQMELFGDFSSGGAGRKIRLLFVNSLAKSFSVSRAPCATDISWLVTGLVTVNGNRKWWMIWLP